MLRIELAAGVLYLDAGVDVTFNGCATASELGEIDSVVGVLAQLAESIFKGVDYNDHTVYTFTIGLDVFLFYPENVNIVGINVKHYPFGLTWIKEYTQDKFDKEIIGHIPDWYIDKYTEQMMLRFKQNKTRFKNKWGST